MTAFVAVVCAVLGLAVGSFLNVVVWRVPRRESVVRPRSRCPSCNTQIAERDNIPVVSWLLLRGRCRHCEEKISVRYPLVESGTALLFAAVGARFAYSWVLPAYLVLTAGLVALTAIDIEHKLLPNRVIYPTWALVAPLLVAAAGLEGEWDRVAVAAGSAAAGFAGYYVLWWVGGGRLMGFGDVRLAALVGAALGWLGWRAAGLGLFILPFFVGALLSMVLLVPWLALPMLLLGGGGYAFGVEVFEALTGLTPVDPGSTRLLFGVMGLVVGGAGPYFALWFARRIERRNYVPFGPYMAAGAFIAMVVSA